MGVSVDYGQLRNVITLAAGTEATWGFEWAIYQTDYIHVDAVPLLHGVMDPANPNFVYPYTIEITRQWSELDENRQQQLRYVTFRNNNPVAVSICPTFVRV